MIRLKNDVKIKQINIYGIVPPSGPNQVMGRANIRPKLFTSRENLSTLNIVQYLYIMIISVYEKYPLLSVPTFSKGRKSS